jgi:exodeoxyribonuclease V alpha subunit
MKSTPEPSTQEVLAGLVERVTFHNSENGFCVLRAKARGHRDLVTVVGHAAIISAGDAGRSLTNGFDSVRPLDRRMH